MTDYLHSRTLAELDREAGLAKGSAFRAFKRLQGGWLEGEHYWLLNPSRHLATIAQLKRDGRAYRSSVQLLLLSEPAARQLLATLKQAT